MIYLGSPTDLNTPTLRHYVYVMATAPIDNPKLVGFKSMEILAETEDQAYMLGLASDTMMLPEGHMFLNDYVHEVKP